MTIDTEGFPAQSLTIRGLAEIDEVVGLAPEYVAAARRYLGDVAATAMLAGMDQPGTVQARTVVRPTWVGLLDFTTRLPSPLGGVRTPDDRRFHPDEQGLPDHIRLRLVEVVPGPSVTHGRQQTS